MKKLCLIGFILLLLASFVSARVIIDEDCEGTDGLDFSSEDSHVLLSTGVVYSNTQAYNGSTSCELDTATDLFRLNVTPVEVPVVGEWGTYSCNMKVYLTAVDAFDIVGSAVYDQSTYLWGNSGNWAYTTHNTGTVNLGAETTGEWWDITVTSRSRCQGGNCQYNSAGECTYTVNQVDGGASYSTGTVVCSGGHDTWYTKIVQLRGRTSDSVFIDDIYCTGSGIDDPLPPNTVPFFTFQDPSTSSFDAGLGTTVNFDIEVDDNESDILSYDWQVDGVPVAVTEDYDYLVSGNVDDVIVVSVDVYDNNVINSPNNLSVSDSWSVTVLAESYSPTYTEEDLIPIVVDGMGTAGATVVGWITFLVILLIFIWMLNNFGVKKKR